MSRIDLKDMVGARAGDRIVTGYAGHKKWLTVCACGKEFVTDGADLRRRQYKCDHDPYRRFWEKVSIGENCWVWSASLTQDGYGRLRVARTMVFAHVFAWEEHNGAVPSGLELDHLCRNRACVNPAHLEPVTHAENVRRGALGEVTRARFARKRLAA